MQLLIAAPAVALVSALTAGLLRWRKRTTQRHRHRSTADGCHLPDVMHRTLTASELLPGRLLIVGDIHGCADELQRLLLQLDFKHGHDNLILVGDLINKGPASLEVLDTCLRLGALAVRGNHDDTVLHHWQAWSGQGQPLKPKHAWVQKLNPEHVRLLEQLPFTISLPDYSITVVHAGMVGGVPLAKQDPWALYKMRNLVSEPVQRPFALARTVMAAVVAAAVAVATGCALAEGLMALPWNTAKIWGIFTLISAAVPGHTHSTPVLRYLLGKPSLAVFCVIAGPQSSERLRPVEKDAEGGTPWAKLWAGPTHVFFGHDAKRRLQLCDHATGLDTGCVYGGQLTAAVVPPRQDLVQGRQSSGRLLAKLKQGQPITREDLGVVLVAVQAAQAYETPGGQRGGGQGTKEQKTGGSSARKDEGGRGAQGKAASPAECSKDGHDAGGGA